MTNRDKIEVPDPLAVEDLIGSKLNNKRKLARLITQCRGMFFPAFVLGCVTKYEYCNYNTACCNTVFFSFFPSFSKAIGLQNCHPCVMSFLLFISFLFLIAP